MALNRAYKDVIRADMIFGHNRPAATGIAAYTASPRGVSAALTGTFLTTPTEAEVVTGGQTIIITLTGATWITAAQGFDDVRQAIIDGLTSAGAEAAGWNVEVRDEMAVTTVVRTSDTAVTVTLPATAAYQITANEVVTVTIPEEALDLVGNDVVATPTITIVAA